MCQWDFNGRFKYRESIKHVLGALMTLIQSHPYVTCVCNACDGGESIILISIRGLQAYL